MIQKSINSLAAAFAGAAFKKELLKNPEERADYKKAQKELDKQWTDKNFVGPPAVSHKAQGKGGDTINVKASDKAQNAWNYNNTSYATGEFIKTQGKKSVLTDNTWGNDLVYDKTERAQRGLRDSIWQAQRGRASKDMIKQREEAVRELLGMQAQGEFASYHAADLDIYTPGQARDFNNAGKEFINNLKDVGNPNFNKTVEDVEAKTTAPSKGKYDQYGTLIRNEVKKDGKQ